MQKKIEEIWKLALPYQDKRNDKGHARITTQYALKLLESENGDRNVVIPAIMLHDIGWGQLSEKDRMLTFDDRATKEKKLEARYKHQNEGVRLGRKILIQVNYSKDLIEEILEIISQHDTREGFISQNEGLVRDSDKLWRFSKTGLTADLVRSNFSFQQKYQMLCDDIECRNYFYSDIAKKIAYEELKTRKVDM